MRYAYLILLALSLTLTSCGTKLKPYPEIGETVPHFEARIGEKLYLHNYSTSEYHYSYWNDSDVCWVYADGNGKIFYVNKQGL